MSNNGEGSAREIAYMIMSAAHLLVQVHWLQFKHFLTVRKNNIFDLIDNLSKRQAAYEKLSSVFAFFHQLQLFTRDEIVKNSLNQGCQTRGFSRATLHFGNCAKGRKQVLIYFDNVYLKHIFR